MAPTWPSMVPSWANMVPRRAWQSAIAPFADEEYARETEDIFSQPLLAQAYLEMAREEEEETKAELENEKEKGKTKPLRSCLKARSLTNHASALANPEYERSCSSTDYAL